MTAGGLIDIGNPEPGWILLVAGAHGGDNGDVAAERRFNETELAGHQVNGIHDIIRLEGEKLLLVGLVIELRQGDDGALGIDITEPSGHHIGFILSQRGMEGTELEEGGTDDCVFLPYSTAARLSFTGTIGSYTITVQDTDNISEAKTFLENKLYDIFSDDDAYTVISMAEMVEQMNSMVNMVIYILAGIAAISLVVGGIGIMNIMLVSVTERTREIGIRKSLGAKCRDIRSQFIIEAGTTSAIGGAIGIILGILMANVLTNVIALVLGTGNDGFVAMPTAGGIGVAFGVSVAVGILFGYLPANKAAKLNPIDALRYD